MITRLYVLHALSPLHAGTGQGVGLIDLPIARERSTEHPLIPGSSLKGVLRDAARCANTSPADLNKVFGAADAGTEANASMVRVSDAHVLAFPVKSDLGTFAWVTSPYVLLRLARDAGPSAGFSAQQVPSIPEGQVALAEGNALTLRSGNTSRGDAVLDGLPFTPIQPRDSAAVIRALSFAVFPDDDPTSRTWRDFFTKRLAIVADDAFTWFTQTATDVRAHIRIGDNGTVAKGALWYEETLPPETILTGVLQVAAVRNKDIPSDALTLLRGLITQPLQVGGNATTGAGRVRLSIAGAAT